LTFIYWLIVLGLPVHAQAKVDAGWENRREEWQAAVPKGTPIDVRNPFGDVRMRISPNQDVWMIANIQRPPGSNAKAVIQKNVEEGQFRIQVEFGEAPKEESGKHKRRVDLTLLLPAGHAIHVETVEGLIEGRDLRDPIECRSTFGKLALRTSAAARCFTRQGEVDVVFTGEGWEEKSRIETITGHIKLRIPQTPDVVLVATTMGEIATDFSLDMHKAPPSRIKKAVVRLGKGGPTLELTSNRGDIKLLSHEWWLTEP